jgi:folate-binding protein YgfZ
VIWNSTSATDLYPLPDEGVLSLTGPDALSFLQGQTTSNFIDLSYPARVFGAFCDVKGRVLADFLAVVIDSETVLLRVSADLCDWLTNHLGKYLQFSRASLMITDYLVLGVLKNGVQTNKQPTEEAEQCAPGWLLHKTLETAELIVTTPAELEQRPAALVTAGENLPLWRLAMVKEAEVRIRAATSGKYLPQDVNYDLSGWVAFDKGCYTGQEIIARLHWRGQPKRRLYIGLTDAEASIGATLSLGIDGPSRGSVVATAPDEDGTLILAEATEEISQGALYIEGSDKPLLGFNPCAQ